MEVPPARAALPPEVSHRLSVHALQQIVRYSAVPLLASVGLVACVWEGVDHRRILIWLAATEGCVLLAMATALIGLRPSPNGPEGPHRTSVGVRRGVWLTAITYSTQGVLLGALPMLVPAGGNQLVDALYALYAVAFASAFLMFSGASPVLFGAYQIPMMTIPATMVFAGYARLPPVLGVMDVVFLVVLALARTEQITGVRNAAVNELRAEQLAARLVRERDRTLDANRKLTEANETLAHRAGHDELTGLVNRSRFLEDLVTALQQARQRGGRVAVLFLDLDRFKNVNDASGHTTGDRLLQAVAGRAQHAVRAGDVVARHGGDEFTVLLPVIDSAEEAFAVAQRLRTALAEPFVIDGQRIDTSSSIGIALDGLETDQAEDLMRHADAALYRAKDQGRDRIELFDESLRGSIRRRLLDEAELRAAIDDGQVVPWFQPVVEMRTGRIVGAEALARWMHPTRGTLLPGTFLPLALDSGLSTRLDEQIMPPTLRLRAAIAPLVPDDFQLALNVPARSVTLEEVVRSIAAAADANGTSPRGITLEITETTVIGDAAAARAALTHARSLGFRVALDDFGTGFSALSLVRDLPLDVIKIDRSFVRGMAGNPADAAVVETVLHLAGRLGLRVVAEGIEDDDDVARLTACGAELAQGFRYSRAVPAEEFETWLRSGPPWSGRPVGPGVPLPRSSSAAEPSI